jgi:peptidyl-prolyl cis-trans isomerase B (cyclophilin B)
MKFTVRHVLTLLATFSLCGPALTAAQDNPKVRLQTSQGAITLELDATAAPATVENFLGYVDAGFFDGTIFHRVIPGFMIQGGGFTESYERKSTRDSVNNEADNGLKNDRGTIAMARTSDPHSATAQFFINVSGNNFLNHTAKSAQGWGYAVFGRVVEGMDVVDSIAALPTGQGGPFRKDVPQVAVVIEKAARL